MNLTNGLYMWEITYICGKWLMYLRNICWEMALLYDKLLKNLENDLEIWEMDKIYLKYFRYMGHGLSI